MFMFKKIFAIILIAVLIGGGFYLVKKYWVIDKGTEEKRIEAEQKAREAAEMKKAVADWNEAIKNVTATDKDMDGLSDEEEKKLGTKTDNADSDFDGLFDSAEVNQYKTDPKNPDTDKDGFKDGYEVRRGYNPNGAGKL